MKKIELNGYCYQEPNDRCFFCRDMPNGNIKFCGLFMRNLKGSYIPKRKAFKSEFCNVHTVEIHSYAGHPFNNTTLSLKDGRDFTK